MESGDFLVLLAMILYFIVVLTIGFVYSKRANSSTSEYFLGGRQIGPWFTALSAEASDMSGYLLMGLPGLAYFAPDFCRLARSFFARLPRSPGVFFVKFLRLYTPLYGCV